MRASATEAIRIAIFCGLAEDRVFRSEHLCAHYLYHLVFREYLVPVVPSLLCIRIVSQETLKPRPPLTSTFFPGRPFLTTARSLG